MAGLFYAIFRVLAYAVIPMDFNYSGWGDWIAWNSVGDINRGITLYFSDWMEYWNIYPIGASLLSIKSVMYIIRIMVVIAAIYCECVLIFRILMNGVLSEHPVDVLACLIILINFFVSILSVTGFRYAQASYYLYGVILCREINRRVPVGIFYRFKNIKISWNFMKYTIFFILIFDFIDISSVLYGYEDYQMSTVDNGIEEFAEETQLEYGIGSYNIVTEPEMYSGGNVSIQPVTFLQQGGFKKYVPYYYADFPYGSNLYNFAVVDYLRWNGITDDSNISNYYGNYIEREEFSDTNGTLCMVLYQFDYDIRWKTRIVYGQKFTGEDVYQWTNNAIALQPYKEGLSCCVELPLGKSRITIVGDGLVENMMEILDNDDIISIKCVLQNADEAEYEIVCKRATDVTLQMSNSTSNWVVVRRLEIQRLYAANYILEDAVDLTREKEVERDFRIPEGEYYVVIRGENLKNASVIFEVNGEKCEYEKVANGDKQLIYKISEEKEKKISIRVQNNGKQTCTIERITYEDAQVQFE